MTPVAQDPETLLTRALEESTRLHPSIARFDEVSASYELAGAPGIAVFQRPEEQVISHVSGSPSPNLVPALDELHVRHLRAAGVPQGGDNSQVIPLVLLCLYLVDPDTTVRELLGDRVFRPMSVSALDEEQGRHDPELAVGDVAIRAWAPLAAGHAPDAGVHPAIVELRFGEHRYERYVPWEGAAP